MGALRLPQCGTHDRRAGSTEKKCRYRLSTPAAWNRQYPAVSGGRNVTGQRGLKARDRLGAASAAVATALAGFALVFVVWNPLSFLVAANLSVKVAVGVLCVVVGSLVTARYRPGFPSGLAILTAVAGTIAVAGSLAVSYISFAGGGEFHVATVSPPSGRWRAVTLCTEFNSPQTCRVELRSGGRVFTRAFTVWSATYEPDAPRPVVTFPSGNTVALEHDGTTVTVELGTWWFRPPVDGDRPGFIGDDM